MSHVSQHRLRQRALVVLGASVLSTLLLSTPAFAGDVQLSGLNVANAPNGVVASAVPSANAVPLRQIAGSSAVVIAKKRAAGASQVTRHARTSLHPSIRFLSARMSRQPV